MINFGLIERLWNEIKSLSLYENIYIEKYQGFALDNKYIYLYCNRISYWRKFI